MYSKQISGMMKTTHTPHTPHTHLLDSQSCMQCVSTPLWLFSFLSWRNRTEEWGWSRESPNVHLYLHLQAHMVKLHWHCIKVIFVQHTRLDKYLLWQHKSGNTHAANSARHKHPKNVLHLKKIIYTPYLQLRENTTFFIVHSLPHYSPAHVHSSHPTQSGLCPHTQSCPITGGK